MELKGHTKGVTSMVYCSRLKTLLSASFDSQIIAWDPNAGTKLCKVPAHVFSIQ